MHWDMANRVAFGRRFVSFALPERKVENTRWMHFGEKDQVSAGFMRLLSRKEGQHTAVCVRTLPTTNLMHVQRITPVKI